jgi:hypothetical protein
MDPLKIQTLMSDTDINRDFHQRTGISEKESNGNLELENAII